jgi:hypothetical protein
MCIINPFLLRTRSREVRVRALSSARPLPRRLTGQVSPELNPGKAVLRSSP